jgi:hypothetical protein
MFKKKNYNFNDTIKFNSANFSLKRPILSERINNKNERFHVSNFNFALNDMKKQNFEIKEIKEEKTEMKIQEQKEEFIDIEVDNDYLLSNNIENDFEFLGKKTKLKETGIEREEIEENISKLKVLKLIEKYSYQNIFILLYKNFLSNKPGNVNYDNYNETAKQEILKLIQEIGLNKVLSIILSIGKSRGDKIKLCFECKEDDKADSNEKDCQNNNKSLVNFAKMLEKEDIKDFINENNLDNEKNDRKNLKEKVRSKLIDLLNEYTSRHKNE